MKLRRRPPWGPGLLRRARYGLYGTSCAAVCAHQARVPSHAAADAEMDGGACTVHLSTAEEARRC